MLEGVLVLATLVGRCRLQLVDNQAPPQLEPLISLHPKGGLHLRFEPRE